MFRGKEKGEEEEQALQGDNATSGGAIEKVAGVGAEHGGGDPERGGDADHAPKAVGEKVSSGTRSHEYRHHQCCPHRLQRGDGSRGEEAEQSELKQTHIDAESTGVIGIKAKQQEITPF